MFDIDGTICEQAKPEVGYDNIKPNIKAIEVVNKLYDEGYKIIFLTSRFMGYNKGDILKLYRNGGYEYTKKQLEKWGVKFHELHMGKPQSHVVIDDRALYYHDNWDKLYEEIKKKAEEVK